MSTAFKAVNGFTDAMEIDDLTEGSTANVYASVDQIANGIQEHALPCTIIPGHWASQIESGELLTEEMVRDLYQYYTENGGEHTRPSFIVFGQFLMQFIARKMGGEAIRTHNTEFFYHEKKNGIWFRLSKGATNQMIMEERTLIPFTTRDHADRIIAQLNIAIRGEA